MRASERVRFEMRRRPATLEVGVRVVCCSSPTGTHWLRAAWGPRLAGVEGDDVLLGVHPECAMSAEQESIARMAGVTCAHAALALIEHGGGGKPAWLPEVDLPRAVQRAGRSSPRSRREPEERMPPPWWRDGDQGSQGPVARRANRVMQARAPRDAIPRFGCVQPIGAGHGFTLGQYAPLREFLPEGGFALMGETEETVVPLAFRRAGEGWWRINERWVADAAKRALLVGRVKCSACGMPGVGVSITARRWNGGRQKHIQRKEHQRNVLRAVREVVARLNGLRRPICEPHKGLAKMEERAAAFWAPPVTAKTPTEERR